MAAAGMDFRFDGPGGGAAPAAVPGARDAARPRRNAAVRLLLALEKRVTAVMLALACGLLALAASLGFYQVLTRFLFAEPSPWSEVGVRMTLIWMVMLGTVAAFRQGALVSVDLLYHLTKGRWHRALHTLISVVTVVFLSVLVWYGADIAWRVRFQELAGLEVISIAWGYLALPVGAAFSILAVLAHHFDPRHMELDTAS